jgi:hypothetical protein
VQFLAGTAAAGAHVQQQQQQQRLQIDRCADLRRRNEMLV